MKIAYIHTYIHTSEIGRPYTIPARAGTATKPVALFTQGALLTTPVNGAWEFNGTALYFTIGGVRKQVQLASTSGQSLAATSESTQTTQTDPTINILMEEIAALKERVNQLESKLKEK